jgi:HD superfamily phosphohydrolase
MSKPTGRVVRDPVWNNVRLDAVAAEVIDTPQFQRLRRVKQLGFAHLVYPGAVHTRFNHAIGVYGLTRRAMASLRWNRSLDGLSEADAADLPLIPLAALLHDVGHYAFSHAMEEVGPGSIPGHHEEMAALFLEAEPIRTALGRVHPDGPERIARLIRGVSGHPLQGLIAGSLDLDKVDYLRRDSFFCGVPYGAVDVDRLLDALTLARQGPAKPLEVAVSEKGLSALESLLFSKYEMFRNVYWHHAVRAASCVFRVLVERAAAARLLLPEELPGRTDEELLGLLARRAAEHGGGTCDASVVADLVECLENRRLPKRAIELFGDALPTGIGSWLQERSDLVRRLEDRLAEEWGLTPGHVFVDYPSYPDMLQLDILLVRRGGAVQRLTQEGAEGLIDLPRLSRSLHHAARVFRVFVLGGRLEPDPGPLLDLLDCSSGDVTDRLSEEKPLYRE